MRKIIFDIETCAYPFNSLTESQQEYLLRYAEKEIDADRRKEQIDQSIRYMSLYPLTAKCIAIGIYDIDKSKSFVYYESAEAEEWQSEDKLIHCKGLSEEEMLKSFWKIIDVTDTVVTFNGRNFDIPFLMIRSAMLKVKPAKNLMGNRYDINTHIDLLDQFTFYGITRKFNLDFYCKAFGIESPKTKEISGMEVKNLYEAGKLKEIASYCAKDIYATYQLYEIWNNYLNL
ncbi:MAG: ribonuclease H-like domain-containing protein [Ignavibacteria bacterium]|jgi:DNA polymerase elongation subunit (family B)